MNSNSPYRYLWIGLTDAAIEGKFVWNSTGQATTYSYWSSGQPDNYNNEDFALLTATEQGRWSDISATFTGAATMCEHTVTPTIPSKIISFYLSISG